MKSLFAISLATVYGLIMRFAFAFFNPFMEIMSITFLCLVPFLIGFLTVRFWKEGNIQTRTGAFFMPWLTSLVILFITILLSIEGAICWIMIYPFFAIAAGLGGLLAFWRMNKRPKKVDDPDLLDQNMWDDHSTLKISLLLLVPLLVGSLEGNKISSNQYETLEKTVEIAATPEEVWNTITSISAVNHDEKGTHLTNILGFPRHLHTTLDTCAIGGKRMAYYEKGLYFEETITELIPNEKLVLDIHVDPDKIPPTVLDEHIVIGGQHVDVLHDTYLLTENADGTTRLSLTNKYMINTPFNWYAGIWAHYLMADLLKGELNMIKDRSEKVFAPR